ncbi:MAG: Gfo/Idh/MocA family oxidoreductase [Verrucomicrobia bacterium]|nr:Gfo/Idh/MocA family oxidoreductase [Verrucomicrobiota bacterium]
MNISESISRRSFLGKSALAGAAALSFPHIALSKEQLKLRVAVIGLGRRSDYAFRSLRPDQVEITALCDVDTRTFSQAVDKRRMDVPPTELWPQAKRFEDYRELFEYPDLYDAVWIATPDHHHFPAAIRAIRAGKAVYCEKPLTWSVWESQQLADEARKYEVATQLGNQGMGNQGWRVGRTYYEAGVLGDIVEVHTFTGSRLARRTSEIQGEDPIPEDLNWDLWQGPVQERPYVNDIYTPFEWRKIPEFGNGALGDWCCHLMNGFYKILEPGYPSSVECVKQVDPEARTFAEGSEIRYEYPAKDGRPGFVSTWYNGAAQPPRPAALEADRELGGPGCYLVGTKGTLWLKGGYVESPRLIPESFRREVGRMESIVPRSHHVEDFIRAAKGVSAYDAPLSHFGYGGVLTASALLGNIASRFEGKLDYDAATRRFTNIEAANEWLQRKNPRPGWYV